MKHPETPENGALSLTFTMG